MTGSWRGRAGSLLVAGLVAVEVIVATVGAGAATAAERTPPRVEDVALEATVQLGRDAPAAVVAALAAGDSLKTVVRRIEDASLPGLAATTTTGSPAPTDPTTDAGNEVVAIDERGITPERFVVDTSSPVIVANRGKHVHVVEIEGTDLPKYSIEPGEVGVYELEGLAPGRYTVRCIVADHDERAIIVVPNEPAAGFRRPVGGRSAPVARSVRTSGGTPTDPSALSDYLDRFLMFDAVVAEMAEGGARALDDAEQIRDRAARAQANLDEHSDEPTTANPARVVRRAERDGVDPETALLTTAILMAANNGYDAGQITEFLLDDALDPVWETGQGPLRRRDVFLAGGVIVGVVPRNAPAEGVFRADAPESRRAPEAEADPEDDESAVAAGRYEGEFTGELLDAALEASAHPGPPRAIRNTVDVKISEDGSMRFTIALAMSASWVSRDDTVTCDSRHDYFATVTPRPTARVRGDGTFESSEFRSTVRQTDFTGPECGTHVYSGENDGEFTSRVVGQVDGDTVQGTIRIADDEAGGDLEFRATRR